MRVDIVIPTINRAKKLDRCLASIINQDYQNYEVCVIMNDCGRQDTIEVVDKYDFSKFWYKIPGNNLGVGGAWNYYFTNFFERRNPDAVLWLVDDVEVLSYTIEKAVGCMLINFPDTDGVVGLAQECPGNPNYTFKWYGQVLLGNKFIKRYKEVNYQVCCPVYFHWFQDQEMYTYASSLNKFVECPEAKLFHYHPAFVKGEKDTTHALTRGHMMNKDKIVRQLRLDRNLNWGNSWTL